MFLAKESVLMLVKGLKLRIESEEPKAAAGQEVRQIYEVKKVINSEPTISFSLPVPDWCLLEQSEFWRRLDSFLEACQSKDSQMSQQEKLKILETGQKVLPDG